MEALDFYPFEGDFGEPGDRTLTDTMVKARKVHTCSHCKGPIAPGERHRSRADVISGDLMRWRWCALCCAAMVAEMNCDDGESFPFEDRAARSSEGGGNEHSR